MKFLSCHVVVLTVLCWSVHGQEGDFQVISGSATASCSNNKTTITNSSHAILHWNDFSIQENSHLHFAQVNAASTVLNRVTGNNLSALMGTLTSNGKVYLINPNGILVGPNALIQTAGFLASTAQICDREFLDGAHLLFSQPGEGKIVNQGTVSCEKGEIIFIARSIENKGSCSGDFVGMASALEVLIQPKGVQRMFIKPDSIELGSIVSTGVIEAVNAHFETSSVYEKAICVEGSQGKLISLMDKGRCILVAENGGIEVSGNVLFPGADVHVLGRSVTIDGVIDVSSSQGGGTVLIGGDFQGSNPLIVNAQQTLVREHAVIRADALDRGNGGKVILWGDQQTEFRGLITAKGGMSGGNGGFVEVSSPLNLGFSGFVDTSAPLGSCGTLLLDPCDVTISAAASTVGPACPTYSFAGFAAANINNSDLVTCLNAPNNVVINASSTGTAVTAGSISVTADIIWTSTGSLTLTAGDFISVSGATISNNSSGGLTLTTTGSGNVFTRMSILNSTLSVTNGNLSLSASTGAASVNGTSVSGTSVIQSLGSGTITVNSEGQGGASTALLISSPSVVQSLGTGTISLTGTSVGISPILTGLQLTGASALVSSVSGQISFTGTGITAISMDTGAHVTSGSGSAPIVMSGTSTLPGLSTGIGIQALSGSLISTINGTVSLTGSSTSGVNCRGVLFNASNLTATGTGTLSITGTVPGPMGGVIGTSGCKGIVFTNVSQISAVSGAVTLSGSGTSRSSSGGILFQSSSIIVNQSTVSLSGTHNGADAGNIGIELASNSLISSTSLTPNTALCGSLMLVSTICLDANGTGGSNSNSGINLNTNSSITSVNGPIVMRGSAGPNHTSSVNVGIQISDSSVITSTGTGVNAATIYASGQGGQGTLSSNGIRLLSGGFSTIDGNITLVGNSNNTSNGFSIGIVTFTGSSIQSTGSGNISLTGTGAGVLDQNHGIQLNGNINSSGTGNITLFGTGGNFTLTKGVQITAGVTSVSGQISITGISSSTGSSNDGILISGATANVSSSSGQITLNGTGGSGADNQGVRVNSSGKITSTVSAPISITGTGNSSNFGILITGASSQVTCTAGSILMTGSGSIGVGVSTAGVVSASSSGTVTINGTGGTNPGILVSGTSSTISSSTGTLTLNGTAGSALQGIQVISGGRVTGTGVAPFILQTFNNGDLIVSTNGVISTNGTLSLTSARDLQVVGGAAANQQAQIAHGSGTSTYVINRDCLLTGGAGSNSYANIGTTGGSAAITMTSVGGNLTLTGGSGSNAIAQIGSRASSASGNITIPALVGALSLNGAQSNSFVLIGHGLPTLVGATLSGDISLTLTNNFTLQAATSGAGTLGFVQIGHVNGTAAGGVFSGNITMQVTGTMSVLGGTTGANAYARIGLGGQAGAATYGASSIAITATRNCVLTSSVGNAVVANLGTGPLTISANGVGAGNYSGVAATGARINTANGNLSITGVGGNTGTNNHGILATSNTQIFSLLAGGLSFTGTGGNSDGIQINASTVTTVDGPLILTGTAIGALTDNRGISILNVGVVSSTGTGTITLDGTGSQNVGATSFNYGILVTGAGSMVTSSSSGNIDMTGLGGGTLMDNSGIAIFDAGVVSSTGTGTLTMNGTASTTGTANNHGIYVRGASALITSVSGAINLTGTGHGSINNGFGINAAVGGSITSTVSAPITLTGTGGADMSSGIGIIVAPSVVSTVDGNILFMGTGGGATQGHGVIVSAGGQVQSTGSGTITMTGFGNPTGLASNIGIFVSDMGSLITSATAAIILNGTGQGSLTNNSGVQISTSGQVTSTVSAPITITGAGSASGNGSNSGIRMTVGTPTISTVSGNVILTGTTTSAGANNIGIDLESTALITSTGSGTITLNGTGSTNGTTGNHGILVSNGTTSITSVTGDIILTGTGQGSGINNRGVSIENAATVTSTGSASVTLAGTGGTTATNSWGVLLTDASTLVSSTGGAITLNGTAGGSTGQGTRITTGAQVASAGSGTVTLATFNTSDLSVDTNAVVITTAAGPITVNSSRDILITGGSNMNETARIDCDANGILSITASRDLVLTGGSNTSTGAEIQNNAPGDAFFTIGRDLILTGGTGSGAEAGIHPTGPTSSLLFGTIGRDLTLTSGSGLNATAHIGSFQTIEDGQILFGMIDGNVTLTATDTNSFAAIGHGLPSNGMSTLSGYIHFPFIMGDVTLQGANAGAGTQGFAQIGHIDQIGLSSTVTGDITINNLGSISVNGGTAATSARAQIGPGGQSMTTIFGAATQLLTAGVNCSLQGVMGFGEAIIINPAGDLTIVVDNLFPTAPGIGPGAFNFGSMLIATGNLKIYTATQSQNNVPTGSVINGQMYSPGPEFVDSPTEEWNTYYPGGTYGGASFKFYYKSSEIIPPTPPSPSPVPPVPFSPSSSVIANQGSLSDLIREFTSQINEQRPIHFCLWIDNMPFCDFERLELER